MKAAVVYGQNDIRIADVPVPAPGPGEMLIKVRASGVCATDVKILGGSGLPAKLPSILGHEVAGTVESLGQGVNAPRPGSRVAVYPIAACGSCYFCRNNHHSLCTTPFGLAHGVDGGFAEYLLVPKQIVDLGGIVEIGAMAFDLAAMIEPISCCLSAAEMSRVGKGANVLIVGAGPLGLLHTIVSKAKGATVIVSDINEERLTAAEAVGADSVLNPDTADLKEEITRITGIGADVVIAALGIPAVIEKHMPLVRSRGVFNIFGGTPKGEMICVDPRWIHYGEITLTGTFAASLPQFRQACDFVGRNADLILQVISARCALEDILAAVEAVKKGTALKTIILFD